MKSNSNFLASKTSIEEEEANMNMGLTIGTADNKKLKRHIFVENTLKKPIVVYESVCFLSIYLFAIIGTIILFVYTSSTLREKNKRFRIGVEVKNSVSLHYFESLIYWQNACQRILHAQKVIKTDR